MNPWTSAPGVGAVLADRYELVRHLARGGMGDVFEARDRQLGRRVAVKRYRATAPTDRGRFDAEVRALAALNHPGLVQVYDAGEHDGDGFIVLELVDGPNLASVLARRGPLPAPEVAALGGELADALDFIHHRGVVHRDVTPSNVLCGRDGRTRLADFGIVRLLDTTRITATATTLGTPAYMAPEQVEGREVTPAADVYALGLVLLEALTGRRAFQGRSHEVAIARLVSDPDVTTGVPGSWRGLLRQMTARDPLERPASDEVRARLRALGEGAARTAADGAVAVVGAVHGVDASAATQALDIEGGTMVMPAALRPVAPPEPAGLAPATRLAWLRSRRALWTALALLGIVLLAALAAADEGFDVQSPTTTTAPVAVTEPPPPTTEAPPTTLAEVGGRGGEGKGKGKGHDDD